MADEIKIFPYERHLKQYFYDINAEWVSDMFIMEDIDEEVLSHPDELIIAKGGHIWFAEHSQLGIVGTCAFLKTGDNEYELTKMGVFKSARGLKIGEKLLYHVLGYAKNKKIKQLYLLTNSKCEAAIHLYLKSGFDHSESIMKQYGDRYERCDVAMKYYDR